MKILKKIMIMRSLLTTALLLSTFVGWGQIRIEKDTVKEYLSPIIADIKNFNIRLLNEVENDYVIMETYSYPPFIDLDLINEVFQNISHIKDTLINDIWYEPVRHPYFKLWASGKITLSQPIQRYKYVIRNKSDDMQVWLYLNEAYRMGVSSEVFVTYPAVDSLINDYSEPVITLQDSI